jgi:hypothetical protein
MFATLLGALPRPILEGGGDDPVIAAIRAQEAAGLEPITDGRLGDPAFDQLAAMLAVPNGTDQAIAAALGAWRTTAGATTRATKQALPGPYSIGWRWGDDFDRPARTIAAAETLAAVIDALAEAGCPLVEIEETAGERLGAEDGERRLFVDAHLRLTGGKRAGGSGGEIHRSLSIIGGSVPENAIDAVLQAPYASVAVDLIAGPDNWYVVRRAARERGVITGVQSAGAVDESKEVMLWGAHYAASSGGRGTDRVGIGSAGSWANLTWEAALRKLNRLGDAARLAAMPLSEELAQELDPRAVSARRAAVGHGPRTRSRPHPGKRP